MLSICVYASVQSESFTPLQVIHIGSQVAPAIVPDLPYLASAVREIILFGCGGDGDSVLENSSGAHCLLGLDTVSDCVNGGSLDRFALVYALPVFVALHHFVQFVRYFLLHQWFEKIVLLGDLERFLLPEIVKDIMSPHGSDLAIIDEVVIVSSSNFIRQRVEGLIDFHKFLGCGLVTGIVFGVVLYGELAVGFLDMLEACISLHSQYLIEVFLPLRVVALQKPPFVLVLDAKLLEELLKTLVGILQRVGLHQQVVVLPLEGIRQCLIGLIYLMELILCLVSIFVPVGMPLGGQPLVGFFDVDQGGSARKPQDVVVVPNVVH